VSLARGAAPNRDIDGARSQGTQPVRQHHRGAQPNAHPRRRWRWRCWPGEDPLNLSPERRSYAGGPTRKPMNVEVVHSGCAPDSHHGYIRAGLANWLIATKVIKWTKAGPTPPGSWPACEPAHRPIHGAISVPGWPKVGVSGRPAVMGTGKCGMSFRVRGPREDCCQDRINAKMVSSARAEEGQQQSARARTRATTQIGMIERQVAHPHRAGTCCASQRRSARGRTQSRYSGGGSRPDREPEPAEHAGITRQPGHRAPPRSHAGAVCVAFHRRSSSLIVQARAHYELARGLQYSQIADDPPAGPVAT